MTEPEDDLGLTEQADGQFALAVDSDHGSSIEDLERAIVAPAPSITGLTPTLRRVWFANFKGYKTFEVTLGRFNVLVGANNAGKSTLLQGVDLLYSLLKVHSDHGNLTRLGRLLPLTVLPVAALRDLFYKGATRQGNTNIPVIIGAEFSDGSMIEFGIRALFGNPNSRVERENGISGDRLTALLARPAVWVPSAVGIVRDEEYRTAARQVGLIGTGRHNEVLRNLVNSLSREKPERFELLQRILAERFSAKLDGVSFDESLDQFVSAGYTDNFGARHDLYSAGAGFIQVVQLLAFVLSRESSVVLLDEPDAHLHSSLQRVVVEILDEIASDQQYQIVLATHSKEIINFVDPTRLIFVSDGATVAEPASSDVTPMTMLQSLGAIDNVDAFALLRNRRCLFIEGRTDRTVLGRFAATLGMHFFTGDDRVVPVPVGGADKFEHVQQLDVFEALLGGTIETLELRDRDARTEDLRRSLMGDAKRPLHVFELDCIESYLLNPVVIARVVVDMAAERGKATSITAEEVEQLLLSISGEMRDETADRVASRLTAESPSGQRPSIPDANKSARAAVAESWESLADRLRLVSGKSLLARMRQALQTSHGANFGNERLAEAFMVDEIPAEVVEQLRKVEALHGGRPG